MMSGSGHPLRLPRRTRARLATALLAIFIAMQPWVTCPLTCLAHAHTTAPAGHHHNHGQPCHDDGSQLRNPPASFQVAGDMLAAEVTTRLAPIPGPALPSGPASLTQPHPSLSAEPPPPRHA